MRRRAPRYSERTTVGDFLDANAVTRRLWVGARPDRKRRELAAKNFDRIVFCAEEYQPDARGYEPASVTRCGIDDGDLTPREANRVLRTAYFLESKWQWDEERILVTCNMGVNRSSLVAATMMWITGWYASDAIQAIRQRRKPQQYDPHDGYFVWKPKPLSNPSFTFFLRSLVEEKPRGKVMAISYALETDPHTRRLWTTEDAFDF